MTEKFSEPNVDESVVQLVEDLYREKQPVYPWNVIEIAEYLGIEKQESRKALRKLRLSNKIVPTGEFKGKQRLAE